METTTHLYFTPYQQIFSTDWLTLFSSTPQVLPDPNSPPQSLCDSPPAAAAATAAAAAVAASSAGPLILNSRLPPIRTIAATSANNPPAATGELVGR